MGSIITLSIVQSALELGFIYALVALALFVSFFPQIMQGPIGRYDRLGKQLYSGHSFNLKNCGGGSRSCIGIRYCIFTDQNGYSVHLSWNHRKYRIIHDQHCGDGFCIQYQSFFL